MTDGDLAKSIALELKLRRVQPGKDSDSWVTLPAKVSDTKVHSVRDHVALISEWDTIYGRTIGPTMIRAFANENKSDDRKCTGVGQDEYLPNQCPWAHEIKYLRGLDGALPRSDELEDKEVNKQVRGESEFTDDQKAAIKDRAKAKADEEAFDHPHGQGQQDYLHRLAKSLLDQDKQLRTQGSQIRAIGVLGSDVFDKLLVLRAMKPLFPQALFFTTDFDYTLTMQSELGWTRNLLVASSFGPTLDPKMQSQIPPFRGSYETSAFLATQLAFQKNCNSADPRKYLKPRIFEIGRTGEPLQLPEPNENTGAQQPCAFEINDSTNIQKAAEPIYDNKVRGLGWFAVLLVFPIVALVAHLAKQARIQTKNNRYLLSWSVIIVSLAAIAFWLAFQPDILTYLSVVLAFSALVVGAARFSPMVLCRLPLSKGAALDATPLSLQAPEKDQSYKVFLRDNIEAIALCIVLIFAAFFCVFWQTSGGDPNRPR